MPRHKTQQLDPTIVEAAVSGLETQRNKLDEQIAQVRALLRRGSPGRPRHANESEFEQEPQRHRRKMSAAARKRIAAAQKKRWAAVRAQNSKEKSASTKKGGNRRKE